MKRVVLFLLTNLAAVLMLTIVAEVVCAFFGVELSGELGGMTPLFAFSFVFGMLGAVVSLLMSKFAAKMSVRAKTIDGSEGEAERWLVTTIADLSRRAGLKMPEVAVYPGPANAFATGAFRNSALVAVSSDIMGQMTRDELRAVLAHEISHIANGDMVTMCLTQGIINSFVLFFSYLIAGIVASSLSSRENRRDNGSSRGSWAVHYLVRSILQTLLGLLASLIVFWYSRKREYAADAGSAKLLGTASPMIAALRRLDNLTPGVLPDSIKAFGITGRMSSLFSTHPSIGERINALMNLPPSGIV